MPFSHGNTITNIGRLRSESQTKVGCGIHTVDVLEKCDLAEQCGLSEQARKSLEDAQAAGYARFETVWAR